MLFNDTNVAEITAMVPDHKSSARYDCLYALLDMSRHDKSEHICFRKLQRSHEKLDCIKAA